MSRVIHFSYDHWKEHPEDYPKIKQISPLGMPFLSGCDHIRDGDILVETISGWQRVPYEAFLILYSTSMMDIERPWLK